MLIWLKRHWRELALLTLVLLVALVWWQVFNAQPTLLKVVFLDIGQGDSIYIEAPNGNQVLIDGGPGRQVLRALGSVMPWYDRSLDVVIATHPDADHIGGLPSVLERYQVAAVMDNGQPSNTGTYRAWQAAVAAEVKDGAQYLRARRGERFNLGAGISLDILYPYDTPTGKDTNDGSIVARLTYGSQAFILTGDATIKVEQQLLIAKTLLSAQVLKAGHHGSKTSSSPAFIKAVSPIYAIISAGKNNRYGHPHQITLDNLKAAQAQILRTDEEGSIVCLSSQDVTTCRGSAL